MQYIEKIVDVKVVMRHQVPTIQTVQKKMVLRASILIEWKMCRRNAATDFNVPECGKNGRDHTSGETSASGH